MPSPTAAKQTLATLHKVFRALLRLRIHHSHNLRNQLAKQPHSLAQLRVPRSLAEQMVKTRMTNSMDFFSHIVTVVVAIPASYLGLLLLIKVAMPKIAKTSKSYKY